MTRWTRVITRRGAHIYLKQEYSTVAVSAAAKRVEKSKEGGGPSAVAVLTVFMFTPSSCIVALCAHLALSLSSRDAAMISATLRAKIALWANVLVYAAAIRGTIITGMEGTVSMLDGSTDAMDERTEAIVRWYHWQLTAAMCPIVYLNASALYQLHSNDVSDQDISSNIVLRNLLALFATLVRLFIDTAEGFYFYFVDGQMTPSFLTTLPFLLLTLIAFVGMRGLDSHTHHLLNLSIF